MLIISDNKLGKICNRIDSKFANDISNSSGGRLIFSIIQYSKILDKYKNLAFKPQ